MTDERERRRGREATTAAILDAARELFSERGHAACVGSLYLGWIAGEAWMRPAAGLQDMDGDELVDGLERVSLSIPKDHVPGIDQEPPYAPCAAL